MLVNNNRESSFFPDSGEMLLVSLCINSGNIVGCPISVIGVRFYQIALGICQDDLKIHTILFALL